MESMVSARIAGWEIHGFHTMEDLDIGNIMEEAKERWLCPNEIHAILCNYKYFTINIKPVILPKSGTVVLFNRKMLRNFWKDGHNWKKKKDGKTVKEAHEHLKVGDEERIHVYYTRGEDNTTFVRRCYWLLDKKLEHIVLVHYRKTQEHTRMDRYESSASEQIFYITEVSPSWAFSTEETKILVIGVFQHADLAKPNLVCVCGDTCVSVEEVQSGVFRCLISPHSPGLANLYMSIDGHKPISQTVRFEFRVPLANSWMISVDDKSNWEAFRVQMRLACLLFSTSKSLNVLSCEASQNTLKEANMFAHKTSYIADMWAYLINSIENNKISFPQAKAILFELTLRNRLQEWLLEGVVEGCNISKHDEHGQGVIHLCATLGYAWAVYPYTLSGLSLDYRDKYGWTALHWAAYYGREKMVATLLSAGAKPNVVTDPTSENPGGQIAADLASKNGYDALAAYLAEKALVEHFQDMMLAGNVSGSLQGPKTHTVQTWNISEDELYLNDTLAAYRTAADAAVRIQAAFREHSLKLRTKAVQFSNPENEARNVIAAMKIQLAFCNHETGKRWLLQHKFKIGSRVGR